MPENNSFMKWFKGLNTGEKIAFWGTVFAGLCFLCAIYPIVHAEEKKDLVHQDSTFLAEQLYSDLCKANEDNCRLREGMHSKEDEIASLKDIIEDLRKPRQTQEETDLATKAEIELAKGNVEAAKGFYADEAKRNLRASDESRLKAAENYRRIGALDFMNNPKEAVKAYEKSVELDPESAIGWNRLGLLYKLLGNIDKAKQAYQEVSRLCKENEELKAVVYNNLANIRLSQGDLEGAEDFYNKALEIFKKFEHPKGMAAAYGNLGNIRQTQGDLEGAEEYWQKALTLFSQIGATREIKKTQSLLDKLEENKDS